MSAERSFEAWEEVQRHSLDLADRLTQGFTGLIQTHIAPPSFPWPNPRKPNLFDVEFDFPIPTQSFVPKDFGLAIDASGIDGVSAILDIGNRIGQAGADLGACFNGLVEQIFRILPLPFVQGERESEIVKIRADIGGMKNNLGLLERDDDPGSLAEHLRDLRVYEDDDGFDGNGEDELSWFNMKIAGLFGRSRGSINLSSTYDSRTRDMGSLITARGDLWRVEASSGSSNPGSEGSSLLLVQLGPILFVRDSTLLFPVHLSKQHLLWYGYDRKNCLHSLCPAVWSKHRRWLLMSMICLNPLACSFMDLQFPNGQLTYVAGEGLTTSAFLPICGGLLQVQGQYPGDMKLSFSSKNEWGTRITPAVQWPDRSFMMEVTQALAWRQYGLLSRPTIQLSLCPTFGGLDPGLRAEVSHAIKEQLSLIGGCSFTTLPSAFAAVSMELQKAGILHGLSSASLDLNGYNLLVFQDRGMLGRSKWNGNVGSSGVVARVETPLSDFGRPSFSVQLNGGIEF